MNPFDLLIRRFCTQVSLDAAARQAIRDLPHTVRVFEPGAYLLREGEPPVFTGIMISGFAYRHKLTVEGARQIVSLHIGGDPIDLQSLFLDVADHNIQTLTRAEIALVPRERMQELVATNVAVSRAVIANVLVDASIFREWIVNVGRRDATARIAHLLCELAVRLTAVGLAEGYAFELPMTQEQIGDAVGLTPVHVNRTLKMLAASGLISRNRRFVSPNDWSALRDAAGFNTRYLHEPEPELAPTQFG